ncbi:MAG: MFS transporter [Chitinophagaceae bacterium]
MSSNPLLSSSSGNLPRVRWLMLTFAFLATVLNYVDRLAFNYLSANGHLRELIPDDAFGYIATAFFVAYMLSNLFSGFIIDRLGTKLGYAICMAFWTTSSLLHAIARLPFHFGIFRFLLGVGEAGNWPAAIKLTSEWFTPEERSTATGIFNSGAAIGAVVAPPLIVWLGTNYGWQSTFIIIGCAGYLWLAAFWFTYYTPERAKAASKTRTIPPMKLIKTKFVGWFTVSKIFMDPVWYFITFWIGRYLVDVHGWSLDKIGWFAMFPFIVSDIGNILGGLLTQLMIRKGMPIHKARKLVVTIFGALLGLSLIAGPLVIVNPATALVVLSIAGFAYAAYTANTMAFPADVVPLSATASVWGVASVGAGLGGAIFQSLSGITIKHLSHAYNYKLAYHTVFVGYGVMAIIAMLIVVLLAGPLKKDESLQAYVEEETRNAL